MSLFGRRSGQRVQFNYPQYLLAADHWFRFPNAVDGVVAGETDRGSPPARLLEHSMLASSAGPSTKYKLLPLPAESDERHGRAGAVRTGRGWSIVGQWAFWSPLIVCTPFRSMQPPHFLASVMRVVSAPNFS
jgi:hypothetical protein